MGKYLFRLEPRTLEAIRALGQNPPEDERRFATRRPDLGDQPQPVPHGRRALVRTLVQQPVAKALRQLHPHRVRFSVLSDRNPFMWPVKMLAPQVRAARRPVSAGKPLLALEKAASSFIVSSLEAAGTARDALTEATFLGVYGLPVVQALVGLGPETSGEHRAERDLVREADAAKERAELEARYEVGGVAEAAVRALVYVVKPEGSVDERGTNIVA